MLSLDGAESVEHGRASQHYVVTPVACPAPNRPDGAPRLSGKARVRIEADSLAGEILRKAEVFEEYFCNFEANPDYHQRLVEAGLKISGWGDGGEARIVELRAHPFFLSTQFIPGLNSCEGRPHPVNVAFLDAARRWSSG